jgi:hypothetical protein
VRIASPQAGFDRFRFFGHAECSDRPGRAFQLVGEIGTGLGQGGVILEKSKNFPRLADEKRQNLALEGMIAASLRREVAEIEYLRRFMHAVPRAASGASFHPQLIIRLALSLACQRTGFARQISNSARKAN